MIKQSAYNLLGGVLPAIAAIVCTPLILHQHGSEFFGIYSLQTALLVMIGLMDLGISRGVTLVTFDKVMNPSGDPVRPFKTGMRLSLLVAGLTSVLGLAATTAYFSLKPSDLDRQLSTLVHLASAGLTILTLPCRALLEIKGRFGRLNVIRTLLASSVFVAPLLPHSSQSLLLTNAALFVLLTRVAGLVAYQATTGLSRADMSKAAPADRAWVRSFARRCGWVGLTNAASLVLTYSDRFLLGAIFNATQVAHYVVASEAATKIWMVTGAVQSASTPKIASELLHAQRDGLASPAHSVKHAKMLLIVCVVAPSMLLMLFSEQVFRAWLGSSYDPAISSAARVLVAGIALNSMSQLNFTLLQLNRGEVAGAHLQLANLLLSALLLSVLIPWFGTMGAAMAFSLRLAVDAFATRYLVQSRSDSTAGFSRAELATVLLILLFILLV